MLGSALTRVDCVLQLPKGLHVRQFRAFDRDGIATQFAVPNHWEVTTLAAIGRAAPGCGPTSALD